MFRSDWVFSLTLAVLIIAAVWSTFGARPSTTSTVVINSTVTNTVTVAQESPYSSFFAAIGSASVIILAWERIAHSRSARFRHLMRRVCPTLFRNLSSFERGVQEIALDSIVDSLEQSIYVLRQYGWFHIDRLYPKNAVDELAKLAVSSNEYLSELAEFRKQAKNFSGSHGLQEALVEAVVRDEMKLGEERKIVEGNRLIITYVAPHPRVELSYEVGQELYSLKRKLEEEPGYRRKWKDGTWTRELVERAKRVQNDFTSFLDTHDMEIDQPAKTLF